MLFSPIEAPGAAGIIQARTTATNLESHAETMAMHPAASGSLLRTFAQLPGHIKWAVLLGTLMLAALAYWLGVQSTSDGTLPSGGSNPPAIFHASGVQPFGPTT